MMEMTMPAGGIESKAGKGRHSRGFPVEGDGRLAASGFVDAGDQGVGEIDAAGPVVIQCPPSFGGVLNH